MPLQKLQFRPGINRDVTNYSAEGTWWDCDKVRFRAGYPEKIGGWDLLFADQLDGFGRSVFTWAPGVEGFNALGIGTSGGYYIFAEGYSYDISPFVTTETLIAGQLETTLDSPEIEITLSSHNFYDGDWVVIENATSVGGIPNTEINAKHVVRVVDNNTFKIKCATDATSSTTGGGTPDINYLPNFGSIAASYVGGWGTGAWGEGAWGFGTVISNEPTRLPVIWSQDNYGDDLVMCQRGGPIYYWRFDSGAGYSVRARTLAATATYLGLGVDQDWIPAVANWIVISGTNAILIALGCNPSDTDLAQDPMFVRWSDVQNPFDWEPRPNNRAGGQRLSSGSRIVGAVRHRQDILIFTDTALYSMQYVGGDLVFSIQPIYENSSILSPNTIVSYGGVVRWMGWDAFYQYDGALTKIPCNIISKVFPEINKTQPEISVGGVISEFNEVIWLYPAGTSEVNDRYALYNYAENDWTFGTIDRSAWSTNLYRGKPLALKYVSTTDVWGDDVYETAVCRHEIEYDDQTVTPTVAIEAFIESADFDIGEGHTYMFATKLIPDVRFDGSTGVGAVTFTFTPRRQPGSAYLTEPASQVVEIPVDQFTPQVDLRFRGRQAKMKIASTAQGTAWKLGTPRLDIRSDGRR